MKPTYLIYGLIDPDTDQVRYVGKSSSGLKRPSHHWLHKQLRERRDRCHNWVRSVLARGKIPIVKVLQETENSEALNELEKMWITNLRIQGCDLTNMTEGGDGIVGPMSLEVKEKISRARKLGNYIPWSKTHEYSQESRQRMRAAKLGKKQNPEHIEKRAASNRGKKRSDEFRKKMSEIRKSLHERKKNVQKV